MNGEFSDGLGMDLATIGTRLRGLRRERGWRLEDLAERTGLSKAYLSRLESGERQPSLTALFGISRAYGVSFSALFEPEQDPQNLAVVRADEDGFQRGNGLLYSKLSNGSMTFNLRPLRIVVPAERAGDTLYQHEGEQWLYVLSGRLCLELGDEELVLGPGDAAHFDADNPHKLSALDGQDAEVILVACAVPYLLLKSYL
ncbi:helix-turn-helix domain-containing protein [Rubrobacter marinus]|uniref:Helix-turn-helix domain-containing protein n=1 Tax=Rubrobacter marinus TaxID=2653852 RepID=A0A6G8Q1L7_9ACTN|nr:XRE family transcriptional regulator [Rubrobacter marinus]QIN80363.1 helix-turn-helix domain-containing protein [Rubrobacter marinus]